LINRFWWKFARFAVAIIIMMSSGLALYIQQKGSEFDPVKKIYELKDQNRRDDALDLVEYVKENQPDNIEEVKRIEEDLKYTSSEKAGSFIKGAVKGEVYDTFSGLGAVSSDLCVYGDIRDLGIHSWRFLRSDENFDLTVMVLSGIGVILSTKPFIHGIDSLAKNTVKYLKRISSISTQGVLKKFLSGMVSIKDSKKIWNLLKKTNGRFHARFQSYPISAV
jgi:hypothetical protein